MRRHKGGREGHRLGDGDGDSLLFCFCCVFVATNQCCREKPCLNSHYFPTKAALILQSLVCRGKSRAAFTQKEKNHIVLFWFFPLKNLIVAFVPTVCRSGRTDHLYCGPVSVSPQEGLPARDLYSCDVFHKLSPGACHGNKSKFTQQSPGRAAALPLLLLILFRKGKEARRIWIDGRDNATDFPLACWLLHCYDQIWLPTTFATHILCV